jgi:ADP-heptose:LPS heptosyltransferase
MRRKLLRNLDKLAGRPIALAALACNRVFRPSLHKPPAGPGPDGRPKRILAIKMVGLGDTVLMLTPLRRLRQRFPDAAITALVTPLSSGIVAGQPSVDEVFVYDALLWLNLIPGFVRLMRMVRKRRFDCVIDFEQHFLMTAVLAWLTGAGRRIGFRYNRSLRGRLFTDPVDLDPERHMVDNYMRLLAPLGITSDPVDTLVGIAVSPEDKAKVSSWLEAHGVTGDDVLVGLHAGSGPRATHRRWDKERFAEIIRRMTTGLGVKIVLTGTAREGGLIREIIALAGNGAALDAGGQFEPKQLAALARRCRLFISNDTGAMHIAAAVGTPTIGLFGPETPRRYAPIGKQNVSMYKPLHCSPCVAVHRGEARECDNPDCIAMITVEDVWAEVTRYDLASRRE